MRAIPEKTSTVQLLIGIVLAQAGAALVRCGQWDLLQIGRSMLSDPTESALVADLHVALVASHEPAGAPSIDNGSLGINWRLFARSVKPIERSPCFL
jgi:hypothetical protein